MSKYVIANWKMNGTSASITDHMCRLAKHFSSKAIENKLSVIVCAPHVYLGALKTLTKDLPISIGGQDCHSHAKGAFTGETSAEMLADVGCKYVLIGHSERRKYNGEDESVLQEKVIIAQHAGLTPILCIGESAIEREQKATLEVLRRQLSILKEIQGNVLISYEPDWAIGTGVTPDLEYAQIVCHSIADEYRRLTDRNAYVIYGGSVNAENASGFIQSKDIDGILVGGASLAPESFGQIIEISAQSS
ncbi:MAG: triose-phosphate isomerase [Holosporales bacterium]|jgi:triosephosphate isomerase|nr:triose-phosphate isomerase [Holosporales bacterium]